MCGIAGVLNFDKSYVSEGTLRKMTEAVAHRGPDGEGFYIDGCIGLGHRRLAIIDLTDAGKQPMSTSDGRFNIVYNGEIYNFKELRAQLQELGYSFKSQSDSEVVLCSYAHWGQDCVKRFNGMFAFAVWDKSSRELFLARDRYGIKPLYYAFFGGNFIFASEQKGILAHQAVVRKIDLEALLEYFTFQNIFTDKTLLEGVCLFPAGCWAKITSDNAASGLQVNRYWDFNFRQPEKPLSDSDYERELNRLFVQAVKRQLVSDVEIGSYLSGGIDSGSITSISAKQLAYIKTFTCGFDLSSACGLELGFDERQKAEYMSYLFKTQHYEVVLKAGDMERIMPSLALCLEEPRVGQCYPNFYVAQLAAKFVKVVLAGTGGDELFAGYPWRYYRADVNEDFENYIDRYYLYWQRLIPNRYIRAVFDPVWDKVKNVWTRDIFRNVFGRHTESPESPQDYINHSLYFEAKTFLHGLLVVEDKLSMAHGLETRVPFLDNDLVDFAMSIPLRLKLRDFGEVAKINENDPGLKTKNYFEKTSDGKIVLRKVMQRYVPVDITERGKQGFSAPDASWFKGESIDYIHKILYGADARIYEFMDRKSVLGLVDEHMQGKENRRLFIWSLLNFEWWCRKFLS